MSKPVHVVTDATATSPEAPETVVETPEVTVRFTRKQKIIAAATAATAVVAGAAFFVLKAKEDGYQEAVSDIKEAIAEAKENVENATTELTA